MRAFNCAVSLVAFALVCIALEHAQAAAPNSQSVGLFEALAAGQVEAKLILQDETAGRVLLKNKTKQPLTVRLPEAFAGAPVLTQLLGFPNQNANPNGNRNNNGPNQGVGVGPLGGGPAGIFNIEPEKVVKVKVVGVCLEHGKRSPNPHVEYRLLPLDEFTSDAQVIEVVQSLGRGELDQKAAQAAAWHLASGLSWKQLAKKIGVRHIGGQTEPFFTSSQLQRALAAVERAERRSASASATPGIGGQ